jgi:hypothetical protein
MIIRVLWGMVAVILVGSSYWSAESAYTSGNWLFYLFAVAMLASAILCLFYYPRPNKAD